MQKLAAAAIGRRHHHAGEDKGHPAAGRQIHQDRQQQLQAAERAQARRIQQAEILHVALGPAQLALHEVKHARRIDLIAAVFHGQHAHFVAGAAHVHGLDLIMAHDHATERRLARQGRQMTVVDERRQADDGVVPPIRPLVALPPGRAGGERAHAVAHAELEHAGKRRCRRQTDHQGLQYAELRVALHQAHEAQDGVARHQRVGIEHDHMVEAMAPALAEIADIAALLADIVMTAAVMQPDRTRVAFAPGLEACHLFFVDGRHIAV